MNRQANGSTHDPLAVRQLEVGDIEHCVKIHLQAFPSFFLAELGPRFLREFYRAFLDDDSAVALVAESRGVAIGVVVGTLDPNGFFRRLLFRRWWAFGVASLPLLLRRPSALVRVARAVLYRGGGDQSGALVSSICVLPAFAGSGVGRRLLSTWCDAARKLGALKVRLETDAVNNEGVNRFYQAQGWELHRVLKTREGRHMSVYLKNWEIAGGASHGSLSVET